jgi:hypothetical protein
VVLVMAKILANHVEGNCDQRLSTATNMTKSIYVNGAKIQQHEVGLSLQAFALPETRNDQPRATHLCSTVDFSRPERGARAMSNSPKNHGEGNPEAAEEFNQAEQKFVNSPQGKEKIKKGPEVRPGEEAELARAEQSAKSHGKNDDSKTTRMKH